MTAQVNAEQIDVLVVGAGISGISGAYHLKTRCQDRSFLVLDNKVSHGGTWLQHKYPGIRSDSDLYGFGYNFHAYEGKPIASAERILDYMQEAMDENDLSAHIRYQQEVKAASWSSEEKLWTVEVLKLDTGETQVYTCNFLWMAQGYYRHSKGYTPEWEGMEDFKGQIVHPQTWPEDLDYTDKNVLVIGSGATAATIIPTMAEKAAHVTMLQRSPTYFIPGVNDHPWIDQLKEMGVKKEWAYDLLRKESLAIEIEHFQSAERDPVEATRELLDGMREHLPNEVVEQHFTPSYQPWKQRVAFMPDYDFAKAFHRGKASVVTDHIDRFNDKGILLKSGKQLEADIIVTATGFDLCPLGDVAFTIDGKLHQFSDSISYRGVFYTGMPNMAWIFGYFRFSWTYRADLLSAFLCRVLNKMDAEGKQMVEAKLRPEDRDMPIYPFLDEEFFNPGYMQRGSHLMPKRGAHMPWMYNHDYIEEKQQFEACDLSDNGALSYG